MQFDKTAFKTNLLNIFRTRRELLKHSDSVMTLEQYDFQHEPALSYLTSTDHRQTGSRRQQGQVTSGHFVHLHAR